MMRHAICSRMNSAFPPAIRSIQGLFAGMAMLLSTAAFATPNTPPTTENQPWAVLVTSQGALVIQLFEQYVPKTVANFIGLAMGTKEWRDPKTKQMVKRPFYNGLTFHKIVPTYWIQAGCPLSNGKGDPGYTIPTEFHPQLQHSGAGIVSMSNAGADRNGSQFFITLRSAPWLNHKTRKIRTCANFSKPVRCVMDADCKRYAKMFPAHSQGQAKCTERTMSSGSTIFGKVIHGLRVLTTLGEQPVDVNGNPISPLRIVRIDIYRAKRWQRSWLRGVPSTPSSPNSSP